MEVTLNGNLYSVTPNCTLSSLVLELELDGKYAIEINQVIIPRSQYRSTRIRSRDAIEIITAIGGG